MSRGSRPGVNGTLSTRLLTDYHLYSIIKLIICWCVWKVRKGLNQDIKMGGCVFQCDVPHQWIAQWQVGPVSVYCDSWGVLPCVCSLAFQCGSTLVNVPLLQASTAVIWKIKFLLCKRLINYDQKELWLIVTFSLHRTDTFTWCHDCRLSNDCSRLFKV